MQLRGSCYVEVRANGSGCDVFSSTWLKVGNSTTDYDHGRGGDHRAGGSSTFKAPQKMYTEVVTTGIAKVQTIII